ncbi:unnamed protein product [Echinostoma caproni]|uniref:Uncharacterized protein n=1 Tax=Echinostoma caproni TaxID=27848 RepID=A0A183A9J0_9TREM|nr:unnamed protein product [Echinostoma caproni]
MSHLDRNRNQALRGQESHLDDMIQIHPVRQWNISTLNRSVTKSLTSTWLTYTNRGELQTQDNLNESDGWLATPDTDPLSLEPSGSHNHSRVNSREDDTDTELIMVGVQQQKLDNPTVHEDNLSSPRDA